MKKIYYIHWHEQELAECLESLKKTGYLVEGHWRTGEKATIREFNPDAVVIFPDRELEKLREFIGKENMHWPQICDEKERKGTVPKLYNINPIPNTYLIDKNGRIAFKNLRGDELAAAVQKLLKS